MLDTVNKILPTTFPDLKRESVDTLQVNLGYKCNQQCLHCHVNAGTNRKEVMQRETIDSVLEFISRGKIKTLDLTGGAPELNPHFRYLITEARCLGVRVIDRCNLTVLQLPEHRGTAEFLARNDVEIIASLPCYLEENVDKQRGKGVFYESIQSIRLLNHLGYAANDTGLILNLVYNPQGPVLPPSQAILEQDYKRELKSRYAISFNNLYTLTNMPIKRFGSTLLSKGQFDDYMNLLKSSFCETNLHTVMCLNLLSVDWQGFVYDCDFNQMLGFPSLITGKKKVHLTEIDISKLAGKPIRVAEHCYACTAGQGSSCGGALL